MEVPFPGTRETEPVSVDKLMNHVPTEGWKEKGVVVFSEAGRFTGKTNHVPTEGIKLQMTLIRGDVPSANLGTLMSDTQNFECRDDHKIPLFCLK